MSKITIFSDGGARGNPGQGAIGATIEIRSTKHEARKLMSISQKIGVVTNNQAEYQAVIEALKWIKENKDEIIRESDNRDKQDDRDNRDNPDNPENPDNRDNPEIECYLDSKLVVEQLNGNFKIKHDNLKPLFDEARSLVMALGGKVSFHFVPREENVEADRLVNKALDDRGNPDNRDN